MRGLVIGASGLVGGFLMDAIAKAGDDPLGTYLAHPAAGLRQLDTRSPAAVDGCFEETRPSIVYLPASLTNVDFCEAHPEESYAHNVSGVLNVVRAANRHRARLVYFSSDYVFDGVAGPYTEGDPVRPICVYGLHKVFAEHAVATEAADWQIIRTTVVYGWEPQGKNFIYRLIGALRAGNRLRAPSDQVGSPTYAPNLAAAVVELSRRGASGVFHVAGPQRAARDTFARRAAELLGLDATLIDSVATSELGQAARRPLDAGMNVDKASAAIGVPLVGYEEALRQMAANRPPGI